MRLFDTTLLVDFARKDEEARRVVRRTEESGERGVTTQVNAFELLLGAFPRGRTSSARLAESQRLLDRLHVLPLDRSGALRAAEIGSKLRAEGRDPGALDTVIAGIALAAGYDTIVTRDDAFRHIPGLHVERY